MNSINRQRGASLLGSLFLIGLLGLILVLAFKLVPIYLNSYNVDTILKNVATEAQGKQYGPNQLWKLINRRLNINSVKAVKKENFHFKREQGVSTISLKYEVRKEMLGNIDAVVKVEHSAEIAGQTSQ